jgi:phosphatidylglycerol---prolipoprotein diacylglyceryl transferase
MAFWMVVLGIIGARGFYVIEYWSDYWRNFTDPNGGLGLLVVSILDITKGGLVVYGAFFGGVTALLLFVRKHHLPLLPLCDVMAPAMLLGLAIGRVGCLLNGCCFGAVCDHPWAITFPANSPPDYSPPYRAQLDRGQLYGFTLSDNPDSPTRVSAVNPKSPAGRAGLRRGDLLQSINGLKTPVAGYAYGALEEAFFKQESLKIEIEGRPTVTVQAIERPERSLPVHPTQVYSTIDALFLCLLLLAYDPFRRRDGELFAIMLTISPITRFIIESLRSDEAPVRGTGMSIAQNVSLLLLVCAAALWFYLLRQPRRVAENGKRDANLSSE